MVRCTTILTASLALLLAACTAPTVSSDDPTSRILLAGDGSPDGPDETPEPDGDDCTLTQGYWKNHESDWPVTSLDLGGVTYDQAELLTFLGNGEDASLILAQQFIAALLNVANGAVPAADVSDALADADDWMADYADADGRLAYGVAPSSAEGQIAVALSEVLDEFNNGLYDTPHCDDVDTGETDPDNPDPDNPDDGSYD